MIGMDCIWDRYVLSAWTPSVAGWLRVNSRILKARASASFEDDDRKTLTKC